MEDANEGETGELLIELGSARVFEPAPGVQPSARTGWSCQTIGRRRRRQSPVFISLAAWQAATRHVEGDESRELGGVLWGMPRREGETSFLEVTEARPATAARGEMAQLTFGHEAWQEVLREQAEGRRVVGWYHSHPGFGIFLSEQDKFIQRHFFSESWQVALVMDPVRDVFGLYGWIEGQIAMWGGFVLFAPQEQRGMLAEEARRFRRG